MRKRTNRDMNFIEEAQRVVLRRNEPPPIHSEVELPPMFFRDVRQRCEEHMNFYTGQIESMREILLPAGARSRVPGNGRRFVLNGMFLRVGLWRSLDTVTHSIVTKTRTPALEHHVQSHQKDTT